MFRPAYLMIVFVLAVQITAAASAPPARPDRDPAVVKAVLDDLTMYSSGGDCPLSLDPHTPRVVYVTSAEPPLTLSCDNKDESAGFSMAPCVDLSILNGMPRAVGRKVKQAERDETRNQKNARALFDWQSSNARVMVDAPRSEDEYQSAYPVSVWSPGYSSDGTIAIVKLWFPEVWHPSSATYVLQSTPRGWAVLASSFRTFL